MSRVYLDHNATTPIRPEVKASFLETLDRLGGNPSSVHRSGRAARILVDEARARTASALAVDEDEVLFTSGGTESANLAVIGAARARGSRGKLATTAAEHSAVLDSARALEEEGWHVDRLPVDRRCRIDLDATARAAASGLDLLSVMAANNEVGTLQPLAKIAEVLKSGVSARAVFHTDAAQALGRIRVRPREWGVDLASFSAHKIGGPLGLGVLYRRRGIPLSAIQRGGGQESGVRSGSENVPAIVAGALAIELAVREQPGHEAAMRALSLRLWKGISRALPDVELLGPPSDVDDHAANDAEAGDAEGARLSNTVAISIGGVDGRTLVARLDLEGLEASAGSACASGSLEPSHVLLAMGLDPERARSGLRLSLGRSTSAEDVDRAVEIVTRTIARLR
jgi:cysteine desulfurase